MIELRSRAEIEAMRPAGRFVAEVLTELATAARPGVRLVDLDHLAHERIRARAGAASCYLDYHPSFGARPFGKVLCTSLNDAVLHGLPNGSRLRDGDVLSLADVDVGDEFGRGARAGRGRGRRRCAAAGGMTTDDSARPDGRGRMSG